MSDNMINILISSELEKLNLYMQCEICSIEENFRVYQLNLD